MFSTPSQHRERRGSMAGAYAFCAFAGLAALATAALFVLAPATQAAACPLTPGRAYRSPAATTVFVITADCQKRPIFNPDVYFSHFASWGDVVFVEQPELNAVPDHTLRFLPWGPRRTFGNNSLLKTTDDPRVYLILNAKRYAIENEETFKAYGFAFNQIEDVVPEVLAKYENQAGMLDGVNNAPPGLAFRYQDAAKVYILQDENGTTVKRYITTMAELNSLTRADRLAVFPSGRSFPDAQASGGSSASSAPTIGSCRVFPADNAWNQNIASLPVHSNSQNYINSIGASGHLHPDFGTEWEGRPIGIPYSVVNGIQKVPINFTAYGEESDPGPYPIPSTALVEGGPDSDGDRHVLVVDESDCKLYELYRAFSQNGGASWNADSAAIWDLKTNAKRPDGWTSADAAGLPILPGLVRYDEVVEKGEIAHALRFTIRRSQRAYIPPASHYASSNTDTNLPPMGLRLRMKASYDCSGYASEVQVICRALKTYGMIVADNGSDWYISGAHDTRWNDERIGDLKQIPGSAFEVVQTQ